MCHRTLKVNIIKVVDKGGEGGEGGGGGVLESEELPSL